LAGIVTPNSNHSAVPGVAVADNPNLAVIPVAFLLHIEIDATAKVVAGQVYTVVFVDAAKSAVPNLPVAIIISP
jgi:hypothetical protein